jgi:hypothetical protein
MENHTPGVWAAEWNNRIERYYFEPARKLNEYEHGFASLVLICSAVEAIGTIIATYEPQVGARFIETLRLLTTDTDILSGSQLIYDNYRCGLIHNGRTNQSRVLTTRTRPEFSAITYGATIPVRQDTNYIEIDPRLLLEELAKGFQTHFKANEALIGQRVLAEFFPSITQLKGAVI